MADIFRLSKEARDTLKLAATASVAAGLTNNVVNYVVSRNTWLTKYLGAQDRQNWLKLAIGALLINMARGKNRTTKDLLIAGGTGAAIAGAYALITPEVSKLFESLAGAGSRVGYIAPKADAGAFIPATQSDAGVISLNGGRLGLGNINKKSALSA